MSARTGRLRFAGSCGHSSTPSRRESTGKYWQNRPFWGLKGKGVIGSVARSYNAKMATFCAEKKVRKMGFGSRRDGAGHWHRNLRLIVVRPWARSTPGPSTTGVQRGYCAPSGLGRSCARIPGPTPRDRMQSNNPTGKMLSVLAREERGAEGRGLAKTRRRAKGDYGARELRSLTGKRSRPAAGLPQSKGPHRTCRRSPHAAQTRPHASRIHH